MATDIVAATAEIVRWLWCFSSAAARQKVLWRSVAVLFMSDVAGRMSEVSRQRCRGSVYGVNMRTIATLGGATGGVWPPRQTGGGDISILAARSESVWADTVTPKGNAN